MKSFIPFLFSLCALAAPSSKAPVAVKTMERGSFDPAWFQGHLGMVQAGDEGLFWMRPGLNLKGRSIVLRPWSAPGGTERLAHRFPTLLHHAMGEALANQIALDSNAGDLEIQGRTLNEDTWELKLVDLRSGEVQLALRNAPGHDPRRWCEAFAQLLAQKCVR